MATILVCTIEGRGRESRQVRVYVVSVGLVLKHMQGVVAVIVTALIFVLYGQAENG